MPADSAKRDRLQFHDADGCLTFDLRGKKNAPEEHVERHAAESLAEDARLLYVAVTRAKRICCIYAGDFQKSDGSALAHLFEAGIIRAGMELLAVENPLLFRSRQSIRA